MSRWDVGTMLPIASVAGYSSFWIFLMLQLKWGKEYLRYNLSHHLTFSHFTFLFFQSEGQMLKEAVYINKSLSFLEQAILALADRHRDHVPFRQSKLTHALKDSLGETARPLVFNNADSQYLVV